MIKKLIITNIKWETDGADPQELGLPVRINHLLDCDEQSIDPDDEDEIEQYASDYLSDTFGFLHDGFSIEIKER